MRLLVSLLVWLLRATLGSKRGMSRAGNRDSYTSLGVRPPNDACAQNSLYHWTYNPASVRMACYR